jgi:hypothetical protein
MLGCVYNDEWLTIYMYDLGKHYAGWAYDINKFLKHETISGLSL